MVEWWDPMKVGLMVERLVDLKVETKVEKMAD